MLTYIFTIAKKPFRAYDLGKQGSEKRIQDFNAIVSFITCWLSALVSYRIQLQAARFNIFSYEYECWALFV